MEPYVRLKPVGDHILLVRSRDAVLRVAFD